MDISHIRQVESSDQHPQTMIPPVSEIAASESSGWKLVLAILNSFCRPKPLTSRQRWFIAPIMPEAVACRRSEIFLIPTGIVVTENEEDVGIVRP